MRVSRKAKQMSPIEVYKLLPKTNCGKCGFPTCMAFAFKLVQGAVEVDKCPYLSDEAKSLLTGMTAPPVALVVIGRGDKAVRVGGEKVSFRHEDKFYNQPVIALELNDLMDMEEAENCLKKAEEIAFERMGQTLKVNALALRNLSGRAEPFVRLVELVKDTPYPLIVSTGNPSTAMKALSILKDERPLLHGAVLRNLMPMASLARRFKCPISVKAADWRTLLAAVNRLRGIGLHDIVIHPPGETLKEVIESLTIIRRLAVDKKFERLGYPTITFPGDLKSNVPEPLRTSAVMTRYSSIVVVKPEALRFLRPVMMLRQSIMMDPRAPISIKPGLYEVGEPTPESPVLVTTNYALTYYILTEDLKNMGVDCYLIVVDTGGLSVACSIAGDKLKPESVKRVMEEAGIADKVKHRTLIIPGRAARLSGDIEDATGWRVLVGPLRSKDIAGFIEKMFRPNKT